MFSGFERVVKRDAAVESSLVKSAMLFETAESGQTLVYLVDLYKSAATAEASTAIDPLAWLPLLCVLNVAGKLECS